MKDSKTHLFISFIFLLVWNVETLSSQNLKPDGLVHEIGYTGSHQDFNIPNSGGLGNNDYITFFLKGADGGKRRVGLVKKKGGGGATVKVTFEIGTGVGQLQPGGKIRFIVGHKGESNSSSQLAGAGGGGGTAVLYTTTNSITCSNPSTNLADADSCWVILAVAGGGGGAYQSGLSDGAAGKGGNDGTCGKDGAGLEGGNGGCNGQGGGKGGSGGAVHSGGGGGYLSSGGGGGANMQGKRGHFNGNDGGTHESGGGWGYGGGGSGGIRGGGDFLQGVGGGGGGGYSGGGGSGTSGGGGGGGGSFFNSDAVDGEKKEGGRDGSPDNGKLSYQFYEFDPTGPIANCKDLTITLQNGTYELLPNQANDGSTVEPGETMQLFYSLTIPAGPFLDIELPLPALNFDCTHIGERTPTLKVFSSSGKTDYCTFSLEILDNLIPTVVCESFGGVVGTVHAGQDFILNIEDIEVSSTDDCGVIESKSLSKSVFTCEDIGSHTVTLFVEDNSENVSTCQANVDIISFTPNLQLNCPSNLTVTTLPGDCTVNLTENLAPDIFQAPCDATLNYTVNKIVDGGSPQVLASGEGELSSFSFDIGLTEVSYDLTPTNSAPLNCSFEVLVEPGSEPVAICQDVTLSLDEDGQASLTTNQIDNASTYCGVPGFSLSQYDFDCNSLGNNLVTLVLQADGFQSECTANVTVRDDMPPILNCVDITVQLGETGTASITPANLQGDSNDNCDIIINQSLSRYNFDCPGGGLTSVHFVTLTAEDPSGNQGNCISQVVVQDVTPPVVVCKNLTIAIPETGEEAFVKSYLEESSFDECGLQPLVEDPLLTFDCADLGTHLIPYERVDNGGNTGSCTASVTIVDNEAPMVTCQDITLSLNLLSTAVSISKAQVHQSSGDNCNGPVNLISVSPNNFDCSNLGSNVVTLTVADESGNQNTCTANVEVEDVAPPTGGCQNLTVQLDASGTVTVSAQEAFNNPADNCGGPVTLLNSQASTTYNCSHVETPQLGILHLEDESGNQGQCLFTVTVEDNIAPVAVCQPLTVYLSNPTLSGAQLGAGSTDNCTSTDNLFFFPIFYTGEPAADPLIFSCAEVGIIDIYGVDVFDEASNRTSCFATITVIDDIQPVALCQPVTVQLDSNGEGSLGIVEIDAGSSDQCGIQSRELNQTAFDCDDVGVHEVILTVTDVNTNTATCTTSISVEDNLPPVAVCQDITVELDENGQGSYLFQDLYSGTYDNCNLLVPTGTVPVNCDDIGVQEHTILIRDYQLNSVTCAATTTVVDDILPTIDCQSNIILNTAPGQCEVTHTLTIPNATDNCEVTVLRYRHREVNENGSNITGSGWSSWSTNSSITFSQGHWKIQWQAKDAANNQKKCSFRIEVRDEEAPNPVCLHPTVTFNGEAELGLSLDQLWDDIASSDNCSHPSLTNLPTTTFTCDQLGSTIPITLNFQDEAGNHAACTADVTIDGLPCNWQTTQTNCSEDAQAGYDPTTATFDLSTEGCYDPGYYSNSDAQGMIQQELCGDGEVIAQVSNINGNAWAGIYMRESNDPTAKTLQLAINNNGITQRKLRTATGGYAFNHQFQSQGKTWLRLTRSGSLFGAFLSFDGIQWDPVLMTNIPMTNCIQAGLFVSNTTSGSPATAWFDNVQITPPTGGNALQESNEQLSSINHHSSNDQRPTPNAQDLMTTTQFLNHTDVQIYPNPTSGALNLVLESFSGQPVDIQVVNQHGQIVLTKSYDKYHAPVEKLWLEHLENGLYFIQVKVEDGYYTKKVNVIH